MPNKTYSLWAKTREWCLANPGVPAAIAMIDGHFTLTWTPKSELLGVAAQASPSTPKIAIEKHTQQCLEIALLLGQAGFPEDIPIQEAVRQLIGQRASPPTEARILTEQRAARFFEPIEPSLPASPPTPDAQCTGPFSDARDCPVHNPTLSAVTLQQNENASEQNVGMPVSFFNEEEPK